LTYDTPLPLPPVLLVGGLHFHYAAALRFHRTSLFPEST